MTLKGNNNEKSVRLYNMIEYCNENRNFKLNDLMSEFNISRSTALRDIKEIEALGVPLYSNPGKMVVIRS